MIELFTKFLDIMFSGLWQFIGCLIIILISSSIVEFIYEKLMTTIQIICRGHPAVNNYITQKEEKDE
jgi:hypothetical protein